MTINFQNVTVSHADHRHWQSEIACWNDDIENWQTERMQAIERLQNALLRLSEHGKCIDEHAGSIALLESSLEYHEKNLAASMKDQTSTGLDQSLAIHHAQEADHFKRLHNAHERLKKHHHQAMAQIAMVTKALEEPC